jgi:hypothetical protein
MPCQCCHARCAFHAALTILFLMQRWPGLDTPQRATRIPRHPDSRSGPRKPVSFRPPERHLSSGPERHGKRAGRRNGAKVNRRPSRDERTRRSLRFVVPPRLLLRTPPVTDDACETGWRPVRVLLHVRIARRGLRSDRSPAKDHAIPKTEGPFTVGIEHWKGSLPECSTGPLRYATVIPALQRRETAPLFT